MKNILIICVLFLSQFSYGQTEEDEFRSPLGIPLILSGTFAELRGNHFHGGIDIKTNAKEGYKIYATHKGYVSRIKVSAGGYGNAIYLTHPNGYTTVYGHLSEFNEELAKYVKEQQYNQQSFEYDQYFGPDKFPVERGTVIALSGNSGSSGGPHLHYEIRKTDGQIPVNPLKFTHIYDNIRPTIYGIRIHELSNGFYQSKGASYDVEYLGTGQYKITEPIIVTDSVIGVSIKSIDRLNGADNKNGYYSLKVYVDDQLNYSYKKDEVSFGETRMINAHVDYPAKKQGKGTYVNAFKLKGNELNFLEGQDGRIWLNGYPNRTIKIEVCDYAGNISTLAFQVQYQPKTEEIVTESIPQSVFIADQANTIYEPGLQVNIPRGALYDDVNYKYEVRQDILMQEPIYSAFHQIHTEEVPLQKFMTVEVQVPNIPYELRDKAVMGTLDSNGKLGINTGKWVGNSFKVKTRNFGTFFVTSDSESPKVLQYRQPEGNNYMSQSQIEFKISDDLAGIKSYRGEINGQWVLFEYDRKRNLLYHKFDERTPKGSSQLVLTVTDGVGNTTTKVVDFLR